MTQKNSESSRFRIFIFNWVNPIFSHNLKVYFVVWLLCEKRPHFFIYNCFFIPNAILSISGGKVSLK